MRGSKDGFSLAAFNKLCLIKGPILIAAKSENNRVFGGFTSVGMKFEGSANFHPNDSKSFIFSLDGDSLHR
jgi:hypothetical protein